MPYKIHVLMPRISAYHVLHHFAKKMHEAFLRLGHVSTLLDGHERYKESLVNPPDFTIGFNGGLPGIQGGYWTDAAQIPHISCLVDPPFHFLALRQSPFIIVTSDDRFFAAKFQSAGFKNLFFMPHAVEPDLVYDSKQERIYDVVMLASCLDFSKMASRWKSKYPKELIRAMTDAIDITLSDETTSFVQAFEITYNECAQRSNDPEFFSVDFMEIFIEIEKYIKGLERINMIKAIHDFPVHVWGNGSWEKYLKGQSNVKIHGEVSYDKSLEILKKTKITLNSSLKNKQGAHERVFSGPACGALVVTSENPYLLETFADRENIIFYRYRELSLLNGKIALFLKDETQRLNAVQSAQTIVMQHHTWDHRLTQLLADVEPALIECKQGY